MKEVNNHPFGKLLEIGVGNGNHLSLYQKHKVTGIDISSAMLEQAKKNSSDAIELFQMNGETLEFANEQFDYIVLSHIIAVTANPEKLLEEAYRVLKPNGKIFILNHFTPKNWLYHIDRSFHLVSSFLHFKSLFYMDDLKTLKRFTLVEEIELGLLSYFKLLILKKS
jgi:phosphatidylethanolamine/phosphatidyl-N-methylethanolamine N-methyltransferase